MIGLLWFFRWPLVVMTVTGMVLSVAWPESARVQFAAQVATDMCRPPHQCPTATPSSTSPLIQALTGPAPGATVYSQLQMERALLGAGIFEPAAKVGAAIGEAESGGRSDAVHLCPPRCSPGQAPERSYGPWQINLLAHPSVSIACAETLACAARAVATISSRGTNWTPWSTFNSGAWGKYA